MLQCTFDQNLLSTLNSVFFLLLTIIAIILQSFLLRVASHPILSWDKIFLRFIQEEKDWKEIVTGTG